MRTVVGFNGCIVVHHAMMLTLPAPTPWTGPKVPPYAWPRDICYMLRDWLAVNLQAVKHAQCETNSREFRVHINLKPAHCARHCRIVQNCSENTQVARLYRWCLVAKGNHKFNTGTQALTGAQCSPLLGPSIPTRVYTGSGFCSYIWLPVEVNRSVACTHLETPA